MWKNSKDRILSADAHPTKMTVPAAPDAKAALTGALNEEGGAVKPVRDGAVDANGIYQPGDGDRAAAVAPNDKPVAEVAPNDKSYKSDESYKVTGGEVKPGAGSKVDESRGDEVQGRTYEDLFRETNPEPRNPALDEKLRRRQRNRVLISGIGDGISALSNLYFTSKYAPNVEQPARLSEGVQKRWDDMMARYNKERDAYNAGLQRARDKDAEGARWERNWKLKLQELKDKNKRNADNIAAADKRNADKIAADQGHKAAVLEETKRHNKEREKSDRTKAAAVAAKARANGGKVVGTLLGKEYYNKADYEEAVHEEAKRRGIQEAKVTGSGRRKKEISYKTNDLAAQVEIDEDIKRNGKRKSPTGNSKSGGRTSPTAK